MIYVVNACDTSLAGSRQILKIEIKWGYICCRGLKKDSLKKEHMWGGDIA